ncbi:lactonase family protein [Herbiconiux liangxiaofengii]|uniref:lactonase family protein n=1 Tax=Herbiconiux liangxiaofengii TaxID=3342795 RepID=UPI0035B9C16D
MTTAPTSVLPPLLWAGGYTPEFGGRGRGLTPLAPVPPATAATPGTDAGGGLRVAADALQVPSPSFVVAHPSSPVLYTADESRATVSAFAVTPGRPTGLAALGPSRDAGPAVCHVAVDPEGRFVTAACWGDGSVLLYPVASDGSLIEPRRAPAAADPHAATRPPFDARTDGPPSSRAHLTLALGRTAGGDRLVVSTDLGYDLLRFWTVADGRLELVPAGEVVLPLGCGPRHLVRLPDERLLVVTEYSVQVLVLEPVPAGDRDRASAPYRLAGAVPVLAAGPAEGDTGAEIALSTDARHAYVGIRGSDRIVTLGVDGPEPRLLGDVASGGRTPRHHLVVGDRLHVAHQDSDEITTHHLGPDGLPAGIVARLPLGSPTVLAVAPTP